MNQQIEDLTRRLAEAESIIKALLSGQVDAVVDPETNSPILLAIAQNSLRESEERYRQIVESTTDGIVKVDEKSMIVFVNHRFAEMLGYPLREILGKSIFSFMTAEAVIHAEKALQRRMQGTRDTVELAFHRHDGGEISVSMAGAPIFNDGGHFVGSLASVRDVTEQKKLMTQVSISDRMASVGTLAAGVAHEINNPLTVVMTNLDFVKTTLRSKAGGAPRIGDLKTSSEDLQGAIDDALEAADRVRIIVRDLMIFSRSADEELKGAVNVQDTLDSALRMAANEIRHRAKLVKEYGRIPFVNVNEARLSQVFLNLIMNAAQAIPEGRIEDHEIRITTRLEGERVVIEVHDTGGGIPPEHVSRIFDAFFTTKPVGVGTGLGLAISHRIVTGMGGELTMLRRDDRGTTFKVALPMAKTESTPDTVKSSTTVQAGLLRGRILVVDDEEMILRIVKRILSPNHEIVTALTGKEALSLCKTGEKFDIILCDLMMPNMGGMEFHRELMLVSPPLAKSMVFVTGGAFTPLTQEFLQQDDRAYISKPFEPANLQEVVQRRLQAAKSA